MKITFETALTIAEGIAHRKNAELTALSYQPTPNDAWVAYFGTTDGSSYVEIEADATFERHLNDFEVHFSSSSLDEKVFLDEDGARALVKVSSDLVIVTRRNLGPYDDSAVGCQVDIILGDSDKRDIHFINTGQVILGGHASFKSYDQDDFEEIE